MAEKRTAAYWIGRFFGENLAILLMAIVVLAALLSSLYDTSGQVQKRTTPDQVQASTPPIDPFVEICGPGLAELTAEAMAAFNKKKFRDTEALLRQCALRIDPQMEAFKLHKKAQIEVVKLDKAEKRKRGVELGMNQEDVLSSSWGRPEKINRTTSAGGTHEQWVYGSGNYLYFQNGVLVTIQH